MCQYRFNCNKWWELHSGGDCTLVGTGPTLGDCEYVGAGGIEEHSVPPALFFYMPKTALKKENLI